ncbi:hypothetical protein Pint_34035 [Pistacia integerrima]|uniref:Uncharacterized protein n=1 Tax=Pistacia integerrima TaxID=434235 RepID=A0ACC0X920_9ROSI|nr:hypothetical protein Pint_34035 [Pistacia integerrima]
MKGSLCLVNPGSDTDGTELDIWVLKDSVQSIWIKQHTISLLAMVDRPTSLESFYWDTFTPCLVLESCSNRSTYILFNSLSELYWYTIDNQKEKKIDFGYSSVIVAASVLD